MITYHTAILLSILVFSLNIIILVQPWVAGGGPTIEWSYLPRKIVREKDYPSEVMEIVYYCTKSGRMSRKLVSGKYLAFHHQVMSDDIDDIQDSRYHMSRRTFFST